jgi:hypothetical protein
VAAGSEFDPYRAKVDVELMLAEIMVLRRANLANIGSPKPSLNLEGANEDLLICSRAAEAAADGVSGPQAHLSMTSAKPMRTVDETIALIEELKMNAYVRESGPADPELQKVVSNGAVLNKASGDLIERALGFEG